MEVRLTPEGHRHRWDRMVPSWQSSDDARALEAYFHELRAFRVATWIDLVRVLEAKLRALPPTGSLRRRPVWTYAVAHHARLRDIALQQGLVEHVLTPMAVAPAFQAVAPGYRWLCQLRGYVVGVEGNIGVGKSDGIAGMAALAMEAGVGVVVIKEDYDPDLLAAMIAATEKTPYEGTAVFDFQMDMLARRQAHYRKALEWAARGYMVLMDRTLLGDTVFGTLNYLQKRMSDAQWAVYTKGVRETAFLAPHAILYLHCTPAVQATRIAKRARDGEEKYDPAYLAAIDAQYERAFAAEVLTYPVVRVDWNADRDLDDAAHRRRAAVELFCALVDVAHADRDAL